MPKLTPEQDQAIAVLLINSPPLHDLENLIIQHCLNNTNADILLVCQKAWNREIDYLSALAQ